MCRKSLILLSLPILLACTPTPVSAQETPDDAALIRAIHQRVIEAHMSGDLDSWMAVGADAYVSVNGGRITEPTIEERRSRRARYVGTVEYSIYRDLREPIVRVSDDGSMGWLAAEVEVKGIMPTQGGGGEEFHDVWAWVELYEKTDSGWKIVGNASNRRDPDID